MKIGKEVVKFRVGVLDVIIKGRGSCIEMFLVYIKKSIYIFELIGIYILIN